MSFETLRTLVLLAVLLPLASAAAVACCGRSARIVALALALLHLALTLALVAPAAAMLGERVAGDARAVGFEPAFVPGDAYASSGSEAQAHRTTWNLLSLAPAGAERPGSAGPNVQFFVGVDGLNVWLLALASVMLVPSILVSWNAVADRPGAYYAWLFVLQAGAIGAFLSFDLILFYAFFELTLVPSFFLIGRWGTGSGRRDAARKFFLYTLAGSLLMLVGLIGLALAYPMPDGRPTFSVPDLMKNVHEAMQAAAQKGSAELAAREATQAWLFFFLMAGFAVKVPIWPFHTWLPAAYGEASPGTTMMVASLLSKLGTFGILRFALALAPDAAVRYGLPAFGTLAAFGIVYAALCAYAQRDVKLTVAYGSVSHLGFLVLGLFAFNEEGMSGAALHMVNHGLTTGALFALLGFLADRYRTTDANQYGGLMGRFPTYAFFSFVAFLASIGLPGLNNFASEMLMLAGLYDARNPAAPGLGLAVAAAVGIFLSAWYVLTVLRKLFFNPLREPPATGPAPPTDATLRERAAFGLLTGLCLALGLFPQVVLGTMRADVAKLATIGEAARKRVAGEVAPPPPAPRAASPAPRARGKAPEPAPATR